MSDFVNSLRKRAASLGKHIVLPESDEPRMYHAARGLIDEGICKVTILGSEELVHTMAKQENVSLEGIETINHKQHPHREKFLEILLERRAKKGMTREQAEECLNDYLYTGALMVKAGDADGMVAGAKSATADVLRATFHCIGTAPGVKIVSTCFVMIVPDCVYGENGMMIMSDCAINPRPTPEELADIAVASAKTAKSLCAMEPRVAMLSFSTMGSGGDQPEVAKVKAATELVKQRAPELQVSGEMQADAALVPSIGERKAPGDPVAGKANVLVFPDLEAANIGYKLVQRLAKAEAIGLVTQGLDLPVNDLSRGCSVDDIISVAAITALQSE
jgi:phosphate acetyltransferase